MFGMPVAIHGGHQTPDQVIAEPTASDWGMCVDVLRRLEVGQQQLSEKVDLQLQRLDELLRQDRSNTPWQPDNRKDVRAMVDGTTSSFSTSYMKTAPTMRSDLRSSSMAEDAQAPSMTPQDVEVKDLQAYQRAMGWHKASENMFPVDPNADFVTRLASGPQWTFLCIAVIVTSTVIVGFETELDMAYAIDHAVSDVVQHSELDKSIFRTIELIVLVWMIVEVLVNAYAQKRSFICGKDWRWNAFDILVVVLSLAMLIAQSASVSFLRVTRVARLIRMGKVLRAFRVAKFLRSVRNMLISLSGSVMQLLSAIFIICTFMFVISLTLMQGIASDIKEMPQQSLEPALVDDIKTLYGSLLITMLTLFRSITSGMDWSQAASTASKFSMFYGVIWVCYIAFMVFGLLNVLTGIFVETAMSAMLSDKEYMIQVQQEERECLINSITEVFMNSSRADQQNMTESDLQMLLQDPELLAYFSALGLDSTELNGLFELLDDDRSGSVGVDEFVTGFLRLKGNAKSVDLVSLMYENKKVIKHLDHIVREVKFLRSSVNALRLDGELGGGSGVGALRI